MDLYQPLQTKYQTILWKKKIQYVAHWKHKVSSYSKVFVRTKEEDEENMISKIIECKECFYPYNTNQFKTQNHWLKIISKI